MFSQPYYSKRLAVAAGPVIIKKDDNVSDYLDAMNRVGRLILNAGAASIARYLIARFTIHRRISWIFLGINDGLV